MVKNLPAQCRRCRFDPWVGKISWRRKWQPTPEFLPGKSHRQRSLAGYSPWGHKGSDTTEWLNMQAHACEKVNWGTLTFKKKVYLSSCWFELDSTKPKVMNNSFALTGARGGVLQRRSKARRLFDWPKLKQLVALFGKAKLAVCSWRLSSFIFSDWSALTLAQVLVCLCFGLLAWGTKALEPIQSHGLLV